MTHTSHIRAAIYTISDSAHAGTRTDTSGPAIADQLQRAGYSVQKPVILPDDRRQIADALRRTVETNSADVIFTTGGTGIAQRDVTPEAVLDVIDREIPGFGEQMRAAGRKSTQMASLSRSLAGSLGTVLIVALPGSPKGALESLGAILELVPHVHDLLSGRTAHG